MGKIKSNRKGFTLIELLAVIVIMGILMMVAIPSVSRIIENSRKDTFVDISKAYTNSVRTAWSADNIQCGSENTYASGVDDGNYYVLIDTSDDKSNLLDHGGKSSWGNREVKGYVRINVTTDVEGRRNTKYYVALTDGTHGIYDDLSNQKESDKLVRGDILMNLSDSSQQVQLESISTKPFINGEVTTCSSEGGNWSITGKTFAEDSWSKIAAVVKTGTYPYQVGDTKTIDMGSLGTHTLRIANMSTPNECSKEDFSQTACGFVLEFADIITYHNMNPTNTNVGGWPATSMRNYLNSDVYNALPSELKNIIIDTNVISGGNYNGPSKLNSTDKIYLLDSKEIYGTSFTDRYNTAKIYERQLDYYASKGVTTSNSLVCTKKCYTYKTWWWLRSVDTDSFWGVGLDGYYNIYVHADQNGGVSPAFRIA